jgi:hypothetical protein
MLSEMEYLFEMCFVFLLLDVVLKCLLSIDLFEQCVGCNVTQS